MKIPAYKEPISQPALLLLARYHKKWDIVEKLSKIPVEAIFASDGCSMWPDEFKGLSIYEDCFWHDVRYWLGGTEVERVIADCFLTVDVARKQLPQIARKMFIGVSTGGADTIFNFEWEWGYGGFTC